MEEKTIEQLMREHQSQPWEFYQERQVLQEPDYKLEAVKAASTIPCTNLQNFMDNCDFIYQYMTYKEKRKPLGQEHIDMVKEAFKK